MPTSSPRLSMLFGPFGEPAHADTAFVDERR